MHFILKITFENQKLENCNQPERGLINKKINNSYLVIDGILSLTKFLSSLKKLDFVCIARPLIPVTKNQS